MNAPPLTLRDVYLTERHSAPSIRYKIWNTDRHDAHVTTQTSFSKGFYFAEMCIDAPEYCFVIKESLERPEDVDVKVSFVKMWVRSMEVLVAVTPVIFDIKRALYPQTVVYSSIGLEKNARFDVAPEFIRRLFF